MNRQDQLRLLDHIWPESAETPANIYALLDAARDPGIYRSLGSLTLDWTCLYAGNIPLELQQVAPYLVRLEKDHEFTHLLLENGWGSSWGVFASSTAGINELRKHFRRLLTVEDEDGRSLVFRYYDPRVLRAYLPTCRLDELNTVFGPVQDFMLEDEDPNTLLRFRIEDERLVSKRRPLIDIPAWFADVDLSV